MFQIYYYVGIFCGDAHKETQLFKRMCQTQGDPSLNFNMLPIRQNVSLREQFCVCHQREVAVSVRCMALDGKTRRNEHSSVSLEDITDVDLHTPPRSSRSLMRLSESAERDSCLIHASSGAEGAGPSERVRDKSRRGKCQACQTSTGQQTACVGPRAMSLTRRWLDLHIIIARWGLVNSSKMNYRQIQPACSTNGNLCTATVLWPHKDDLLQSKQLLFKYLMSSFGFSNVLFDIVAIW